MAFQIHLTTSQYLCIQRLVKKEVNALNPLLTSGTGSLVSNEIVNRLLAEELDELISLQDNLINAERLL